MKPNDPRIQVDEQDAALLGRHWTVWQGKHRATAKPYAMRREDGKTVYLHRLIMQPAPGMVIDHINGDTLDNRRANLRTVTRGENNLNKQAAMSNNRLAALGVSFMPGRASPYVAEVSHDGQRVYRGYWRTKAEAAAAAAAIRRFIFEHGPPAPKPLAISAGRP